MTGANSVDKIADLLERAHEIRLKGLNCAETVLWALGQYWNAELKTSYATGLGGGVARLGETCGALTGAIVALSAKVGRTDPADSGKKGPVLSLGTGTGPAVQRRDGDDSVQGYHRVCADR